MRDEAFARLGGAAPAITITSVTDFAPEQDARIARKVRGTVDVPSYLNLPGGPPGSKLNYGADGLPEPQPGNIQKARFACNIPRTASAASPARPSLFGHGLLGTLDQIDVGDLKQAAVESNTMFCGADWIGMATEDIPNVISVFGDFTRFQTIPDRQQQSYLNFLFLGRALSHPAGLTALAAFRDAAGRPLATRTGLVYVGASQGGIQGGALMALAQDFTLGLLAVPAMNYSTLLNRSTQFDQFQPLLDLTYPDKLDQQIGFALIQMLWDRGEANGYADHIVSDPLPGTPAHRVLLHEAFGDHQVANVATETMARTMGIHVHRPALAPGRSPDVTPVWDVPSIPSYPFPGSALVIWDSGTPAPPTANVPNRAGHDPHGDTGHTPAARQQAAHFLTTGEVIDTCGGGPCVAIH
jgi:hypothetical protein